MTDSLITIDDKRRFPICITNETGCRLSIPRNKVIARLEPSFQVESSDNTVEINVTDLRPGGNQTTIKVDDLECVCNKQHEGVIKAMLSQNTDLFARTDKDLTPANAYKVQVDTGNHAPIRCKPYPTPVKHREVIDRTIEDMLQAKIIEPSNSSWAFPVVLVKKADGSLRFCVDFRKLNAIVKSSAWPMPRVDEILPLLGGSAYFTKLDMKSGFWQLPVDKASQEKLAFTVPGHGLYHFLRLPFGLVQSPSQFQACMNKVLRGCEKYAIPYVDDIIVFSKNLEDHLKHIQEVFDRLRQNGLKLKLSKCSFLDEETHYLGFILNKTGYKPDPDKVRAIRTVPPPKSVKEVRSFIGMCGFYRRIVPNFSEIAKPLTELTKKYARFSWSNECQLAFETLKERLATIPMLGFPDRNRGYRLYTDASDTCIGAVLCQECEDEDSIIPGMPNERPIHFLSHKLSPSLQKCSTVVKECFALKFALDKLSVYVQDTPVTCFVDHQPLVYLLTANLTNKKLQSYALAISGYQVTIKYVPGVKNKVADMLSRCQHGDSSTEVSESELQQHLDVGRHAYVVPSAPRVESGQGQGGSQEVNVVNLNLVDPNQDTYAQEPEVVPAQKPRYHDEQIDMHAEQSKDKVIQKRIRELQSPKGQETSSRYIVVDKLLYFLSDRDDNPQLRLCIPQAMTDDVIRHYHDQAHLGVDKIYDSLKIKYFWPNMYKEIYKYTTTCVVCLERSKSNIKLPVQETRVAHSSGLSWSIDTSGPFKETLSGNKYIIAFVDEATKWVEAFPVRNKTAEIVADLLLDEIIPRFSFPYQIRSDNGTEFCNQVIDHVCKHYSIGKIRTSPYHPEANGQVEIYNKFLKNLLSKATEDNSNTWDLQLNACLTAIRCAPSESTRFSPFFLLYGRDPVLPLDSLLLPQRKYMGESGARYQMENIHKAMRQAHSNMRKAKRKRNQRRNQDAVEPVLQVGQAVMLKNHNRSGKLDSYYKPYYRIIEQLSPATFRIKNVADGTEQKVHAKNIKTVDIDDWDVPRQPGTGRRGKRKATLVVPPSNSDTDSGEEESRQSDRVSMPESATKSEMEYSDDDVPLAELIRRKVNEREYSSDSDGNVPLAELQRRVRQRTSRLRGQSSSDEQASVSIGAIATKHKRNRDQSSNKVKMLEMVRDMVSRLI